MCNEPMLGREEVSNEELVVNFFMRDEPKSLVDFLPRRELVNVGASNILDRSHAMLLERDCALNEKVKNWPK